MLYRATGGIKKHPSIFIYSEKNIISAVLLQALSSFLTGVILVAKMLR